MKMNEFKKKIGKRIKILRIERDLTQEQLAELVGDNCNSAYISNIESGARLPSFIRFIQFAQAFKITANELLDNTGYLECKIMKYRG